MSPRTQPADETERRVRRIDHGIRKQRHHAKQVRSFLSLLNTHADKALGFREGEGHPRPHHPRDPPAPPAQRPNQQPQAQPQPQQEAENAPGFAVRPVEANLDAAAPLVELQGWCFNDDLLPTPPPLGENLTIHAHFEKQHGFAQACPSWAKENPDDHLTPAIALEEDDQAVPQRPGEETWAYVAEPMWEDPDAYVEQPLWYCGDELMPSSPAF